MFSGAVEITVFLFKSTTKIAAIVAAMVAFVVFMTVVISGVNSLLSGTVIMDLLSLVQTWLPFNIDPIILWLGTSASLYIFYRVALLGYHAVRSVINS